MWTEKKIHYENAFKKLQNKWRWNSQEDKDKDLEFLKYRLKMPQALHWIERIRD